MFSRICASWLVLLILAPFTAPFSTCDLSTLVGAGARPDAPLATPSHAALTKSANAVATPPVVRTASRVKAPALSVRHLSHVGSPRSAGLGLTIDPPDRPARSVTLATVLRL